MPKPDSLLSAIEAVYAAGFDETLWPRALAQITRTIGGIAGTLETFDRTSSTLMEFHAHGLPPANEIAYLDHYSALNPRIPALIHGTPGNIVTDYSVIDERSMNRHPFYSELLAPAGYRYCVAGTLERCSRSASLVSIQRTKKQGHVDKDETELMRLLLPHVRQAFEMTRRLRGANAVDQSFRAALDWLSDGVALLRADGRLVYANESLQTMLRRGDNVRIRRGMLEFAAADARSRFAAALGTAGAVADDAPAGALVDFAVARRDGEAPYMVSARPLARTSRKSREAGADVIVFVHDPLQGHAAASRVLCEVFGLTDAEAGLARALQEGIAPSDYARGRLLSLNTVYTHLRRIKEKTGCHRMAELIRRLNELQVTVRSG